MSAMMVWWIRIIFIFRLAFVSIIVWDDENVFFLDQSGVLAWLRRDEMTSEVIIGKSDN